MNLDFSLNLDIGGLVGIAFSLTSATPPSLTGVPIVGQTITATFGDTSNYSSTEGTVTTVTAELEFAEGQTQAILDGGTYDITTASQGFAPVLRVTVSDDQGNQRVFSSSVGQVPAPISAWTHTEIDDTGRRRMTRLDILIPQGATLRWYSGLVDGGVAELAQTLDVTGFLSEYTTVGLVGPGLTVYGRLYWVVGSDFVAADDGQISFVTAGVNQATSFGALTAVGEGAFDTRGAVPDGTYGEFDVSGGIITPNTSPLTVGQATVGAYSVDVVADTYTVATPAEFVRVYELADTQTNARTMAMRAGTYDLASQNQGFVRDGATALLTVEMNGATITNTTETANADTAFHAGRFARFEGGTFYMPQGAQRHPTNDYTCTIVELSRWNTSVNVQFDGCTFRSNYGIAKNGDTRGGKVAGIQCPYNKAPQGLVVENCTFEDMAFGFIGAVTSYQGNRSSFESNLFQRLWGDPINPLSGTDGFNITNNVFTYASGDGTGLHTDGIQLFRSGSDTTSAGIHNMLIEGNVMMIGEGLTSPPTLTANLNNEVSVNADFTVTSENRIYVDASGGPVTITLPASGSTVQIQKVDASANAVTVASSSNIVAGSFERVDNTQIRTIPNRWNSLSLLWNGSAWSGARLAPTMQGIYFKPLSGGRTYENIEIFHNVFFAPSFHGISPSEAQGELDKFIVGHNYYIAPYEGDLTGDGVVDAFDGVDPKLVNPAMSMADGMYAYGNVIAGLSASTGGVDKIAANHFNYNKFDRSTVYNLFAPQNDATGAYNPRTKAEALATAAPRVGGPLDTNGLRLITNATGAGLYDFSAGARKSDATAPTLIGSSKRAGADGPIILEFDQIVTEGTGNVIIHDGASAIQTIAASNVTFKGAMVEITPATLSAGTIYIRLDAGVFRTLYGGSSTAVTDNSIPVVIDANIGATLINVAHLGAFPWQDGSSSIFMGDVNATTQSARSGAVTTITGTPASGPSFDTRVAACDILAGSYADKTLVFRVEVDPDTAVNVPFRIQRLGHGTSSDDTVTWNSTTGWGAAGTGITLSADPAAGGWTPLTIEIETDATTTDVLIRPAWSMSGICDFRYAEIYSTGTGAPANLLANNAIPASGTGNGWALGATHTAATPNAGFIEITGGMTPGIGIRYDTNNAGSGPVLAQNTTHTLIMRFRQGTGSFIVNNNRIGEGSTSITVNYGGQTASGDGVTSSFADGVLTVHHVFDTGAITRHLIDIETFLAMAEVVEVGQDVEILEGSHPAS